VYLTYQGQRAACLLTQISRGGGGLGVSTPQKIKQDFTTMHNRCALRRTPIGGYPSSTLIHGHAPCLSGRRPSSAVHHLGFRTTKTHVIVHLYQIYPYNFVLGIVRKAIKAVISSLPKARLFTNSTRDCSKRIYFASSFPICGLTGV